MKVPLPSRTSISASSPSALASTYLDVKPSRLKALLPSGVAVRAVSWGQPPCQLVRMFRASLPPSRNLEKGSR